MESEIIKDKLVEFGKDYSEARRKFIDLFLDDNEFYFKKKNTLRKYESLLIKDGVQSYTMSKETLSKMFDDIFIIGREYQELLDK